MAHSEMTDHVSPPDMELFCRKALSDTELATVATHLAKCSDCHQQLVGTLRRQRGVAALSFTLAPEFWLRHEHIEYEQLVELAEDKLSETDREVMDLHLNGCTPCKEDVRSLLAFREKIALELEVSNAHIGQELRSPQLPPMKWWRSFAWKPIYATTAVVIGVAVIIGVALLLKRRAETLQVHQTPTPQVSPVSSPDNRAASVLSPPATPNESSIEKTNSADAIVVLNDRGATITVDKTGNVVGLDSLPNDTREQIAQVLLSERLEAPPILKELRGQGATLRGSTNAQPSFKLTYPSRMVIVSDQPTFKWGSAAGANSYRVYVNDPAGNEIAKSEELPSERTEWKLPKPLTRGEIYLWTVVAVVAGREIVSPGPSSAEMKFQVLSTSRLLQLNKLRKTRSHLGLGVFYAREGMVKEALREFQTLVRDNPRSQHAKKLLKGIESWER